MSSQIFSESPLKWESNSVDMDAFMGNDPLLEILSEGYRFLEGPVWVEKQNCLYFSDIPGNAIYEWSESKGASVFRPNSYLANGNTFDGDRFLISCEHGTSRVTKTDLVDGSYIVLAERYQGKELNSPNDVVVDTDGNIYFTDPAAGRGARVGIPRPQILDFQGVYRVDRKNATVELLEKDMTFPNGLCFSPDGSILYVNDSRESNILAFDVDEKGMLFNKRIFADFTYDGPGVLDGMKCCADGTILCTGPKGIYVIDSFGIVLGRILIPEVVANFTFGETEDVIFLAATSTLYRIKLRC